MPLLGIRCNPQPLTPPAHPHLTPVEKSCLNQTVLEFIYFHTTVVCILPRAFHYLYHGKPCFSQTDFKYAFYANKNINSHVRARAVSVPVFTKHFYLCWLVRTKPAIQRHSICTGWTLYTHIFSRNKVI